jgi:hypothetical protein
MNELPGSVDHLQRLFDLVFWIGLIRGDGLGTSDPVFSAEEEPAHTMGTAWSLVDDSSGGFRDLFDAGFSGDIVARHFDAVGLTRVAELYRFAQTLVPPDFKRDRERIEARLSPAQNTLLDLLTERVRRARPEIIAKMIPYLESIPSVREWEEGG